MRDLPGVGANLQNHPCVALTAYLSRKSAQPSSNPSFLQNWLRYSSHSAGCDSHDMHLMAFNKCAWHPLGSRVGTIVVSVLKAYSTGRVELSSADPTKALQVQFNLLSDTRDYERLRNGLRFGLELLSDPAVMRTRHEVVIPNGRLVANLSNRSFWNGFESRVITTILDCAPLRRALLAKSRIDPEKMLRDEGALRTFVRRFVQPQFHVSGTCRMGLIGDERAVVDSDARVLGTRGLRVVDASIFPTIPRGYPHFIVIMVAEKLADVIKRDWRDNFADEMERRA